DVAGELMAVAAGGEGVYLYDLNLRGGGTPADPHPAPVLRAHVLPGPELTLSAGAAVDVALEGNLLFVAARNGSLQIWDVTDPAAPLALNLATPVTIYGVGVYRDAIFAGGRGPGTFSFRLPFMHVREREAEAE